ncbi:MAG: hypothetical protein WCL21_13235 [Mariniphaga sp.]
MKKIITVAICLFAIICLTQSAQAQKYLTFESKSFSVLLKCSPDYTKVLEISFSEKGAWVPYKFVKTLPLDNKTAMGNVYVVEDVKTLKYSVEYMFEKDKEILKSASCSVVNQNTRIRTTLQRKK